MINMNPYRIQFINGYIEVEERKSPNGTPEAKCTLHPMAQTAMLFQEVVAWANENNYTHTKLLMRGGDPYVVAWQQIQTEEQE